MTPRKRWLAALDSKPVDRLPFWPKLNPAYTPAQDRPFRDLTVDAVHEWIGSDQHVHLPNCTRCTRRETGCELRTEGGLRRTTFATRLGVLERVDQFDEGSLSWHPVKMPVTTRADIAVMTAWYEDAAEELDPEQLRAAQQQRQQLGDSALLATNIGTSPLMEWIEHIAGVENAHLLLFDHRAEVERLFTVMHRNICQRARVVVEHCPADLFYMVENTSTTLLSPSQFRKYCFPHLRDIADITREHGRRPCLHMCGTLKRILPDLATLPVAAFEAFTSPPVGDTRFLDGRDACPDVCLVGGTNATLWLEPTRGIIAEIESDLDALPHHRGIVVTSAGVMPPLCTPETIRTVGEWVKAHTPN